MTIDETSETADERPETANYRHAVEPDDHIMTVAEYLSYVAEGDLIDDDGFGTVVRHGLVASVEAGDDGWPAWIRPSDGDRFIPKNATHIVWSNR